MLDHLFTPPPLSVLFCLTDWSVDLYLGFLEILEGDLLEVINDSSALGRMLAAFNSTFLALIPKLDSPISFDEFL